MRQLLAAAVLALFILACAPGGRAVVFPMGGETLESHCEKKHSEINEYWDTRMDIFHAKWLRRGIDSEEVLAARTYIEQQREHEHARVTKTCKERTELT